MSKRIYSHSLISYLPPYLITDILFNSFPYLDHYAYILHDKDENEPHHHILLHLTRAMTTSAVCSRFKTELSPANTFNEPIKSDSIATYLLHENEPEKHQYNLNEVISNDFSWWLNNFTPDLDKNQLTINVVNDLIVGVSPRELMSRYGRDIVINYQKYRFFADLIKQSEKYSPPQGYYDEEFKKACERLKRQADELGITLKGL